MAVPCSPACFSSSGCGAAGEAAGVLPSITSWICDLIVSDRVPKIACTLLPTSSTPDAPSFFRRFLSTPALSLTSTRRRVIQASRCVMFSLPPSADKMLRGRSSPLLDTFSVSVSSTSSDGSSRPGVLRLNFRITKRNPK
ncbi:hypothetical protein D3C86_1808240 [compost metagenome]